MHKDGAFVLALDEATGLGYLLGDIRRLWQAMGEKIVGEANRLVMLLLDTNSNVSHLAGQEALVKSDRLENKELKLLPVFTKLPYDVAYNALSREEQNPDGKTWGTLLKQLPRMGRPLLNNQHLKYVTDEESGYEALRPFVGEVSLFKVQAKLLTDKEPALKLPSVIAEPETSAKLQDPAEVYQVALDRYLAALCSRLPLRFIGLQGTVDLDQFLQRQVSSHLRTISDVNTTTNFISTGTPSEPLLSIAAADLFRKPRKNQSDTTSKRWEEAIFAIRFARKFYGLTAGEDGEEVMRLLLMMATDLAAYQSLVDAASEGQGSTDREVMDHWERGATLEPISLWDWLGELFGATNMAAATTKPDVKRRRSPGTSAGSGIEPKDRLEAFARSARINFTHFAPLPESIAAVTKEEVASWFVSHVALCGVPMQASWDMLIPVYVDPDWNGEQTLIDVSKFSYVVIQVKNRLASVPRGKTEIVPPVMLAHPRVPARAGSTRRGETAAASSSRSAARPFASAPRGKACAPPAQFEYLSLFVELQPAFETEAQGLRYTYDEGSARGSVAHKLHAIGLENAFGALLKKMQEGLVDLICTLIGADRNEVKEELNWETECKTICDYQKSLYTRKVKPVTATTSTANH
ncbi:uncharacterized protein PFL1_05141 [Pseudozyma flocculosa PF-1]|nr:uncharacterized protein PFL1_05141 [Pseudozyma flocculosa PF-1]EPQ27218.1 hypothetical protein PFL1_05141 [Pseudozyma flocculosa PF-1]